ncbi:MAG TPA: fibronectin type III domain-containing protein [Chthoniobacterales bacterium]|jgi:hypothetical protein
MIKLISGFGEYTPDGLAKLGEKVSGNLPNIPVFATLIPPSTDIAAGSLALRAAIDMTGLGRKEAIESKFAGLAGLLSDIAMNAPQVLTVTDTDLAQIGIPVVKAHTRETQTPPSPQALRLRHGQMSGDVLGVCDPAGPNIRNYVMQWTLDPNAGPWTDAGMFPNSRAFKLSGMPRGKDIWVRVAAVNTVGQGPWSDPATIMVT